MFDSAGALALGGRSGPEASLAGASVGRRFGGGGRSRV